MRALAILLLLAAPAASAAEFDIPWFQKNPAERQAWLRLCRDDARLARRAECDNAKAAEVRSTRARGRLGHPLPDAATPFEIQMRAYGARRT
ncbi:EexN family lipoprotein [Roseomonas mucosa]|uniref:EexN family lipoprotein n=1 Tax=Roseomonas mucosa TaxID=207340 RepID=UPI0022464993|nr:EexN family lipoprotein [Roseomonas mucosa]UZO91796.1 Hypothetical protein RMP42_05841 [Roseomonas mucosa]